MKPSLPGSCGRANYRPTRSRDRSGPTRRAVISEDSGVPVDLLVTLIGELEKKLMLDRGDFDIDIAAGSLRVRTALVGSVGELLHLGIFGAGN